MPWKNIKYKAILFDLDGTLIDSMTLHNQTWIEVLSKYNCSMTPEILTEYTGVPNFKTVQIFNERFHWKLDPQKITNEKEAAFLKKLPHVQAIDLVIEVVKQNLNKVPMAVVTGSAKEPAIKILKNLNLEKYFASIITAADTQKHKPDPEPFLLGAEKLKVKPKDCLVFEDGALGIKAAHAAGMRVIKVIQQGSEFKLKVE